MSDNEKVAIGIGRDMQSPPKRKLPPRRLLPPVRNFCPTNEQLEEQMREEMEAMMEEENDEEESTPDSKQDPEGDTSNTDLSPVQSNGFGSEETCSIEVTGREMAGAAVVEQFQDIRKVKVCRVLSPDEFYITLEECSWFGSSKEKEVSALYKEFQLEMSKNEHDLLGKEITVNAIPKLCYAYEEPIQKEWRRVRLLRVISNDESGTDIGLVYFVDMDFYQFVAILALRHLPEKFAVSLVPIIRCYLHNVTPNETAENGLRYWSSIAISYVRKLLRNSYNNFRASIAHWSVEEPSPHKLDMEYCAGVELFVSTSDEEEMFSLGPKLIKKGFAAPSV